MTSATRPPLRRWAALALAVAAIVLVTAGLALQAAVGTFYHGELAFPGELGTSAAVSTFSIVGLAIVSRHPRHSVAWVLLLVGLTSGLKRSLFGYAAYRIVGGLDAGADAALALLIAEPMDQITFALVTWLLLLFPDGRLMSRRWGLVGGTATLAALYVFFGGLAYPRPLTRLDWLHIDAASLPLISPLGIDAPREQLDVSFGLAFVLSYLCLVGGAASLVVRLRRSSGEQRQQLKWFAYACFLSVLSFGIVFFGPEGIGRSIAIGAVILAPGAMALAIGIAILRYRLYDIDMLINRTLVYGATSAAIAFTFYLGLVALQPVLRRLTLGSEPAVAASTLISFGLFQPVRRRIQDAVDRHFDRSRYDAARMLDAFADRVRDEVDLDTLRADLLGAVRQTVAPAHASLWLREQTR